MLPSAAVLNAAAEPDPLYFFVSRAHADRDRKRSDPDFFVRRVFDDLCRAVRERRKRSWEAGYLDPCVPSDNADAASLRALSAARVLVALYSEHYLRDGRSQALLERFRGRFSERPEDPVDAHVLPVMWEPTAEPSRIAEFRHAIELVPDLREYAELGLAGIHRLKAYRGAYERLLALFSRWIVDVAEGTPAPTAHWVGGDAGPGGDLAAAGRLAPGIDYGPDDARPTSRFVIAVLALSTVELPDGRDADRYGRQPIQWRPYGITQPMPVVSHASVRAPIQHTVDLIDHEVTTDTFAESAGLLLVDPWILALPQGRQRLMRTLKVLPPWAPPVVLADQNDPQYHPHGVHHVEDAIGLCNATCPGANERRDIPDAEAFDVLIPYWVNFSYRRFRDRPTRRARKSYGRRPRLGDPFRDGEGSATDD